MSYEQLAMTPRGHGVTVFNRICGCAGAPMNLPVCRHMRECFSMSGGRIRTMSVSVHLLAVLLLLSGICLNAVGQEVAVYPQMGHTDCVTSVAFSPDGKQILSGSLGQTIKLWDTSTGKEIRTFSGHTSGVNSVTFSPDGRQVLSGSDDSTIKLWDITTGREIRTFSGHRGRITSVTFSPNGRQILSGSSEYDYDKKNDDGYNGTGTVKLWDANTGREIRTFVHTASVTSVAFSPDGKQILSGSYDNTVKLWDANIGKEIRTFVHIAPVTSVAFSPDGKQCLSDSYYGHIKLWDVNTGREIRTFSPTNLNTYHHALFNPNGKQILFSSSDIHSGVISLWDIDSGLEIMTFSGSMDFVTSITFNHNGKQVLSGSGDGIIKLWDTNTGRDLRNFSGYTQSVASVTFSPDGRQVISRSNDGSFKGTLKLWDVSIGRELKTFSGHTSRVSSVIFSPDGKQILSGSSDRTIKLWDVNSGREIRTFSGYTQIDSVTFSPDGRQILSGFSDGIIKLWDVNSGREIRTFSGHTSNVISVAFNPDGSQVLSASDDSTIRLWDVNTGRERRTFSGHTRGVNSVTFSPDGRQLLSGYSDNTVKLWDANTGREIRTFYGYTGDFGVLSVTFSPDGKQILSGSYNSTIILWDVNTGREIKTFLGHTHGVNSVSFSPDGKYILSGSYDNTIRLWDVSTGKEIAQFISFIDGEWLVLTPDGYYNASPNGDKYLNVRVGNNVYGIDQYRNTFYKPQVVEARLQGRPDPVRVTTDINNAASFAPPVVKILSPENGAVLSSNQVELSVSIIDEKQPIKTVKVLVNGRLVGGDSMRGIRGVRGGDLETTGIRLTDNQNKVEFRLNIVLDPGKNRIEVIANNPYSEGRDSIEVTCRQPVSVNNALPNLWILSIGVNRYDDTRRLEELKFAVNDAKAIIDVFKTQEGRRYGKVNSLLIADDAAVKPTHDNIVDNFKFLRQAGPQDVILLFIAGHGVNDRDGNFYFMPSDAAFNADGSIRDSKAISSRVIQQVLNWPGQKLVFIDACNSAGTSSNLTRRVNNDRLVMDLISDPSISSSSVIFTSSKGDQSSYEMDRYKHGVFTYTLLEGLKGAADLMKKGEITMTALELYIREKIPALTDGQQNPTTARPNGYDDFVVVKLNN